MFSVRHRGFVRLVLALLLAWPAALRAQFTYTDDGAALTVTLRRGGLLTAILVLPLAIPLLIFGVSAAAAATSATTPFLTPFLILCALTLGAVASAPFAVAAALRHMSE